MCINITEPHEVYFHAGFRPEYTLLYGHVFRLGVAAVGLYFMRQTITWNHQAKLWASYLVLLSMTMLLLSLFHDEIQFLELGLVYTAVLIGFTAVSCVKKSPIAVRATLGIVFLTNLAVVGSFFPVTTFAVEEHKCEAVLRTSVAKTQFRDFSEAVSVSRLYRPIEQKSCSQVQEPPVGRVYHGPFTITRADGSVTTGEFKWGIPSEPLVACMFEPERIVF